MSSQISNTFRKVFPTVSKETLQWFPGHMGKGLKQMQEKLKLIDCVIEVHDARIPISGRNMNFKNTLSGVKPHILVLNKRDLIDKKLENKISDVYQQQHQIRNVVFTNCKNQKCTGIRKIIPLAEELISNSYRFNRSEDRDFCIMIIGIKIYNS